MASLKFPTTGPQEELLRAVIAGREDFFQVEPMEGGAPLFILVARGAALVAVKSLLTGKPMEQIESAAPTPEELAWQQQAEIVARRKPVPIVTGVKNAIPGEVS